MSLELKRYIQESLRQGASRKQISATLTESGWAEAVVQKTLDQFAGVDSYGVPIPAPRMQAHQIARDLGSYCLVLITLALSAFALGSLSFELINHYIPDATGRLSNNGDWQTSWAIAQLIVGFPVYTWLTRIIQKDIVGHPEKRESLIRKLMIYFILVITAIVGLSDLIQTIAFYLQGDITLRFLAKAGTVIFITQLIFGYYLYEMRLDDRLVRQSFNSL